MIADKLLSILSASGIQIFISDSKKKRKLLIKSQAAFVFVFVP